MPKPQQPELHRSRYGSTDRDSAELRARERRPKARRKGGGEQETGPVPEENRPGHRPEQEQDKPEPLA